MFLKQVQKQLKSDDIEVRRQAVLRLSRPPASEKENFINLLLDALKDASWRIRKTAVDVLIETYPVESYIAGIIALLYEENVGTRNSAIEALEKLQRKATEPLIRAFDTPDADVRKFIVDIVGRSGDRKAVPLLVKALDDPDENVRASAAEHLGAAGEPSVVDALIGILEGGDLWTAYPSAAALGKIGDKRAVPALIRALAKKTLREPALKALGAIAEPETLANIVPFIDDKSKTVVQEALNAVEMLYRKGVPETLITESLKSHFGERVFELLLGHAWSKRQEVRRPAILLLGLLKDEWALLPLLELSAEEEYAQDIKKAFVFIGREKPESLVSLFEKNDDFNIKRFLCEVAAEAASPLYLDVLKDLISSEDGHTRALAARGLANIGDESAIEHIERLFTDPFEDVQEAAVESLSMFAGKLQTGQLIKGLDDREPLVRKNTALVLGRIRDADAVAALSFSLKDVDVGVRKAIVSALSAIKTGESSKNLVMALTDEDPDIRASAALSLGMRSEYSPVEPLALLLKDPDDMVRASAARALGMLGSRAAVSNLVHLLLDPNGFVLAAAVDSLGKLGGQDARLALIGMLTHKDKEIRRSALLALANFEDVEREILPFLRDSDWATRAAAANALAGRRQDNVRREIERVFDEEEDPIVKKALENYINA